MSDDGEEVVCIGSVEELEQLSGEKVDLEFQSFFEKILTPTC